MSKSKSFILKCSMCFKVFDYHVQMTSNKENLWDFLTVGPRSTKKYAVFCTENIATAKNLIKVALKKCPQNHRLIIITHNPSQDDIKLAEEQNYGVVSYDDLSRLSEQMVNTKNLDLNSITNTKKNTKEEESPNDFIDKVIFKEKLF